MLISFVSFGDTQLESQILAQKCCTKKARRPLHIKWCNSFKNQYFFDIFFLSGSLWSWEQVNNRWNYCIFDRNEMAENLRKHFFASDFSYKFRIKIFHIYWCNSLKNQLFFDFFFWVTLVASSRLAHFALHCLFILSFLYWRESALELELDLDRA